MGPIAPVMSGIAGVVNLLLLRRTLVVGLRQSKQVLQREHGQQRAAFQVLAEDDVHDPRLAGCGTTTRLAKDLIKVALSQGRILQPPASGSARVVDRRRADCGAGVGRRMIELHLGVSGHSLHSKAKNMKLGHHLFDTMRNHAEVLTTDQHRIGGKEGRQPSQGFKFPHLVVSVIVKVHIDIPECRAGRVWQLLERIGLTDENPRVIVASLLWVFK